MAFASKTHYVRYTGGAQSVIGLAVDGNGKPAAPSSATYTIVDLRYGEDSSDRETVASTAATVDSASTTLSAAAGAGTADTHLLSVADGSGFTPGHRYLLTDDTTGRFTEVAISHKNGNSLYTEGRIPRVYASGSTLVGLEVTATFPAAEAADEDRLTSGGGPYAVDWTWVGVDPTTQRDIVWVKRTPWLQHFVSLTDCDQVDPAARSMLRNETTAEAFLDSAHNWFYAELRAVNIDPGRYAGGENAAEAVKHYWAHQMRRYMPGDVDDYNDRLSKSFLTQALVRIGTITGHGNNPVGTVRPDVEDDHAEDGTSIQQPGSWTLS